MASAPSTDTVADALVEMMDKDPPTIPEAVVRFYLNRAGFDTQDPRLLRVVSLAAHKFIADIAKDAMGHHQLRSKTARGGAGAGAGGSAGGASAAAAASDKKVLRMDDLTKALHKHGVEVCKPGDLYVQDPGADAGARGGGASGAAGK